MDIQNGYRRLKEGGEKYDKYFSHTQPQANEIVIRRGLHAKLSAQDINRIAASYASQTLPIAKYFASISKNRRQLAKNIWEFMTSYIQYKQDEGGAEQIRTPRRSWKDRKTGIDCDCMTTFANAILLHIVPKSAIKTRIASYLGLEDWQHVYTVLEAEDGTEIILDAVITQGFDIEKPYNHKHDITMEGYTTMLNGLGNTDAAKVPAELVNAIADSGLQEIIDMRRGIDENPIPFIALGHDIPELKSNLTHLIDVWNNKEERDNLLEYLVSLEGNDLNGLGEDDDYYDYGLGDLYDDEMDELYLSGAMNGVVGAIFKKNTPKPNQKTKPKLFTAIGNFVKTVSTKVKAANTKIKEDVKKVGTKVATAVKNGVKELKKAATKAWDFIKKFNPLSVAGRALVRLGLHFNIFGLSKKWGWAYKSKDEALAAGVSAQDYDKYYDFVHNHLEPKWVKFGGTLSDKKGKNPLKESIMKGFARKGLHGELGEPVTIATTVAAGSATGGAFLAEVMTAFASAAGTAIVSKMAANKPNPMPPSVNAGSGRGNGKSGVIVKDVVNKNSGKSGRINGLSGDEEPAAEEEKKKNFFQKIIAFFKGLLSKTKVSIEGDEVQGDAGNDDSNGGDFNEDGSDGGDNSGVLRLRNQGIEEINPSGAEDASGGDTPTGSSKMKYIYWALGIATATGLAVWGYNEYSSKPKALSGAKSKSRSKAQTKTKASTKMKVVF